ncbi:MAG TPA: hypothetical protein VD966_03225, partial [Pyrinomonadaceae bacterium]|nr:hypothetical protein [Pyrinomonadaceae bacterium]
MESDSHLRELLTLVEDTVEYLSYLRELGVEGVEHSSGIEGAAHTPEMKATDAVDSVSTHQAALRRNA